MNRQDYLSRQSRRDRPPGQHFWLSLAAVFLVMVAGTVAIALL